VGTIVFSDGRHDNFVQVDFDKKALAAFAMYKAVANVYT
jgi:hypothetical protein